MQFLQNGRIFVECKNAYIDLILHLKCILCVRACLSQIVFLLITNVNKHLFQVMFCDLEVSNVQTILSATIRNNNLSNFKKTAKYTNKLKLREKTLN